MQTPNLMAFALQNNEPALIVEFRQQCKEIFAQNPDSLLAKGAQESDIVACRFLRARNLDVKEAVKMFKASMAWRTTVGADTIGQKSFPFLPQLKACYPYAFHKFDKEGRPIYIDQTGYMNIKEIMKLTTMDNMVDLHIKQCEFINQQLYKMASERAGKEIYQVTTIVDLKKLSSKNLTKRAYNWLKACSKIDQDNYPESLGKLFVVNVPTIFGAVWAMVSPWLDKRTKQKIVVLKGKNFAQALLQHIDADSLPVQYGGTCNCQGGCLSSGSGLEEEWLSYALNLPKGEVAAVMNSCNAPPPAAADGAADGEEDAASEQASEQGDVDDEKEESESGESSAQTPKGGANDSF